MKNQKAYKNNKGFTLVELIVVIVILAILAAILIPGLLKWIDEAKDKQYQLEARSIYMATQAEMAKNYTGTVTNKALNKVNNAAEIGEIEKLSGLFVWSVEYKVTDGKITDFQTAFESSAGGDDPITMSWKTGGQWKKCELDDYDG